MVFLLIFWTRRKKIADLQFIMMDLMSLRSPLSSNGCSIPLNWSRIRVAIFREKKLLRETRNGQKFWRNSVCFRGAKNAKDSDSADHFGEEKKIRDFVISFRTISRTIKCSEFRSEPFHKSEKHSELCNFVPNHSAEEKKMLRIPFQSPNYFIKEKTTQNFGIQFQNIFAEEKNTWNFIPNH